jgi:hypothetical protein
MFAVAMGKFDGLACAFAEEIKFCASGFTASNRLDINDIGRMYRENTLDALFIHNAADSEGFADTVTSAGNNGTGEYLNTLFVALSDFAVDVNNIADFKMRHIFSQAFTFNSI